MTREEAIERLKTMRWEHATNSTNPDHEAFDMAIEALSTEPCEDAISRQAVMDAMYDICGEGSLKDDPWRDNPHIDSIIDAIEDLPSVTPKQKMCFDGMTNGEVIDSLFPNMDIYHNRDFTLREMIFPDEWWDAPYRAESEDTE